MTTLKGLLAVAFVLASGAVPAGGDVIARDAWIRAAPPGAPVLAGYLTLVNPSDRPRVLAGARAAEFGSVMVHRTFVRDGVARMVHEPEVVIPARGEIRFAPGGYHLMLIHPKGSLAEGGVVTVTLIWDDGGGLDVRFEIRRAAP